VHRARAESGDKATGVGRSTVAIVVTADGRGGLPVPRPVESATHLYGSRKGPRSALTEHPGRDNSRPWAEDNGRGESGKPSAAPVSLYAFPAWTVKVA